ncbi:hypothetical protein STENM36S_04865 [Streptomyces tendae]
MIGMPRSSGGGARSGSGSGRWWKAPADREGCPPAGQNGPVRTARRTGPRAARRRGAGDGRAGHELLGAVRLVARRRPGGRAAASQTKGTTARAARATVTAAGRQSYVSTIQDSSGRKISCPEAEAAVRTPVTRPRRSVNQRLVTVAAKARAIDPEPRPTSSPQHRMSCQAELHPRAGEAPEPTAITHQSRRRTDPHGCPEAVHQRGARRARWPVEGEVPRRRRTDRRRATSQNSWWSGSMRMPGRERKAAAADDRHER